MKKTIAVALTLMSIITCLMIPASAMPIGPTGSNVVYSNTVIL